MIAIKTINLVKCFKEKTAVKDLNISIDDNSLYAFLGLNGAGKSTTIKLLTGLIKPTSGDANVFDYSINTDLQKIKEITSVSPQETALAMKMTVTENLLMMARIYGMEKDAASKKSEELIKLFGLEEYRNTYCKKLSGGYQRRVSIALALISSPQVLFLDEPTLGLDIIARRELWKIINDLKKDMTIILTTHYLEEAAALADKIGVINNGTLLFEGGLSELLDKTSTDNIEDAFIKICGGDF